MTVDLFLSDRMLKVNRDISLFFSQQIFVKILIPVIGILADLSLVHSYKLNKFFDRRIHLLHLHFICALLVIDELVWEKLCIFKYR